MKRNFSENLKKKEENFCDLKKIILYLIYLCYYKCVILNYNGCLLYSQSLETFLFFTVLLPDNILMVIYSVHCLAVIIYVVDLYLGEHL